jgi:hypothetical protein
MYGSDALSERISLEIMPGLLAIFRLRVTHIDDEAATFAEALAPEHANILLVAKELERRDKLAKQ